MEGACRLCAGLVASGSASGRIGAASASNAIGTTMHRPMTLRWCPSRRLKSRQRRQRYAGRFA